MSNVKAGDLAIVNRNCTVERDVGRIVDVLYEAPAGRFQMPCGCWVSPDSRRGFVCKYVGGKGVNQYISGLVFYCTHMTFLATSLSPLPGDESTTTTEREVTA